MRGGFLTQPHASRVEDAEASQEGRAADPPPPKRAGHWSWKNKAQEGKTAASAEPRLGSGAGSERHASQPSDSSGVDTAGTTAQDRRADTGFEHVVQRDLLAGRAKPKESRSTVRDAAKHDSLQADTDGPQNGKKAGGGKAAFSSWAGKGSNGEPRPDDSAALALKGLWSQSGGGAVLPEDRGLRRGLTVRICGLGQKPELNGEEGKCLQWDSAGGRWKVRLDNGMVKCVRPENLEEPFTWSMHYGYIATGGDLFSCTMTIEQAIIKCGAIPECKGFCFESGLTDDPVRIIFKSKWDLVAEGQGWTSYRKVEKEKIERPLSESERAFREAYAAANPERSVSEALAESARQLKKKEVNEVAEARKRRWMEEQKKEMELRRRPDYGKPTNRYNVGDTCEVINGITVRRDEDMASQQLRRLPNKSRVVVVQIGTGPGGKRLCIRDEYKRQGWVSVVSSTNEYLLRVVRREDPSSKAVEFVVQIHEAARYLDKLQDKLEGAGIDTFHPEFLVVIDACGNRHTHDEPLDATMNMYPLTMQYCMPKADDFGPAPREYSGLPLLARNKVQSAAIPVAGLHAIAAQSQEEPAPQAALAYEPPEQSLVRHRPVQSALPWDLEPLIQMVPRRDQLAKLGVAEQRFRDALRQDNYRMMQGVVEQIETIGIMPDFIKKKLMQSWRGPLGHEPFEYKGKIYTMRSIDSVLFDPSTEEAVGIWSAEMGRVMPVAMKFEGEEYQTITFFGQQYYLMPMGQLIDPREEVIIGAYNSETMLIEPIWPIPLKWAEFMEKGGLRIEAGRFSASDRTPFIQILPKKKTLLDSAAREDVVRSVEEGSWQALKHAPSDVLADREVILKALKQRTPDEIQNSWQILAHAPPAMRQDREVVLEAAKQDPDAFKLAAEEFRNDRELMLVAVQHHALALRYADDALRTDRDLVLEAVRQSWRALKESAEGLRGDREILFEAVRQSWQALEYAAEELRGDRELVRVATGQSWRALEFAAAGLRADSELLLECAGDSLDALQYAADELLADREFMLQVMALDGSALKYAARELRTDPGLALLAVKGNPQVFKHLPQELRKNRELVLEAVKQDWEAFTFAAQELHADRELVLEVMRQNPEFIQHVPHELRADRGFMFEAVQIHGLALKYAADELRVDQDLVLAATQQNWQALKYSAAAVRADRGFMLGMVKHHAPVLSFASAELCADRELVLEAASQDWGLLRYAAASLCMDHGFMSRIVRTHGSALRYATGDLDADRGLVLEAVQQNGQALEFASEGLRDDSEVVLAAARQNWEALEHASERLRGDRGFVLEAIKIAGMTLRYASEELREDRDLVLEAVKLDWRAYRHATLELRIDRSFVLRVVQINALALSLASEDLRADPELIQASMKGVTPWRLQGQRGWTPGGSRSFFTGRSFARQGASAGEGSVKPAAPQAAGRSFNSRVSFE